MASESEVKTNITADPSGFIAGWKQAVSACSSGAEAVKGSIGQLGKAFEAVQKPLLVISGLLAGGKFFKETIEAANKLNGESMSLAKSMGITGTQASTLRTALGMIGSDGDTYIGAFQKFAKQVKTNEEGLQALGLKTRDVNGDLRDSNTMFTEALQMVGSYKAGLNQAETAMDLFGKGVDEVMKLQKLNNTVLSAAEKQNKDLGLTVTKEGVDASKKYGQAMGGLSNIFLGIEKVIGQAVMPIFTQLAEWFSGVGPTAVFVFKVAIDAVATALQAVVLVAKTVWNVVRALADPFFTFGSAVRKLLEGDMKGATDEMMKMGESWGNAMSGVFDKIGADASRTWREIGNLWGKGTEVEAPKGGENTRRKTSAKGDGDKGRMAGWESELAERKAAIEREGMAEGQLREMSKAEEQKYWDAIRSMAGLSVQEKQALARKAAETEMAGIKQSFEAKVASLQAEGAEYRNNTDERLRIERQIQAMYQEGTKEYEAAAKKINEIKRQAIDQDRALEQSRVDAERAARLQGIAVDEQANQTAVQLGIMSHAQQLAAELQFEKARTEIAEDALMQRLNIALQDKDKNPQEIEKVNRELEQLEQQHQLRMGQIKGQLAVENAKGAGEFFKGMQSSLQSSIMGILQGTQTLKGAFQSLFSSMANSLAQSVSKMAIDWLMAQLKMRAASKETALSQLNKSAVAAAGNAYNAVVGIPYVGPVLAPAAAAVAYAGVMAFGAMSSAEGGFDIPGNVDPITQLHRKEMVLPAKHADVIRNLADNPAGGAAAQGAVIHFHGQGGEWVHKDQLAGAMRELGHNFAFVSP